MKKTVVLQAIGYMERYTCLIFTLLMALNGALKRMSGEGAMRLSSIFTLLALSLGTSLLSFFIFSDLVIKRAPAMVRYALYCACLGAALAPLGVFADILSALTAIALALAVALAIWLSNRARAKLYNAKLAEYQRRLKEE